MKRIIGIGMGLFCAGVALAAAPYLNGGSVLKVRNANGSAPAGTCRTGELFVDSTNNRLCACTASNTWKCAALSATTTTTTTSTTTTT